MIKHLYKGQLIAIHILDEYVLPFKPLPIILGGTSNEWEDYRKRALEIVGHEYTEQDIWESEGYLITIVEEVVGDQVLFRDNNYEMRLAPGNEVVTEEEAPRAFEIWRSL